MHNQQSRFDGLDEETRDGCTNISRALIPQYNHTNTGITMDICTYLISRHWVGD